MVMRGRIPHKMELSASGAALLRWATRMNTSDTSKNRCVLRRLCCNLRWLEPFDNVSRRAKSSP